MWYHHLMVECTMHGMLCTKTFATSLKIKENCQVDRWENRQRAKLQTVLEAQCTTPYWECTWYILYCINYCVNDFTSVPRTSPTSFTKYCLPPEWSPIVRDMHTKCLCPNANLTGSKTTLSHIVYSFSNIYAGLVCILCLLYFTWLIFSKH